MLNIMEEECFLSQPILRFVVPVNNVGHLAGDSRAKRDR